jgi:hypothetical protein
VERAETLRGGAAKCRCDEDAGKSKRGKERQQ